MDTVLLAEYRSLLSPSSTLKVLIVKAIEFVDKFPHLSGQEKKDSALDLLKSIANGPDGISGTSDDIIQPQIIEAIQQIMNTNILWDIIDSIVESSKGNFDINKVDDIVKNVNILYPLIVPIAFSIVYIAHAIWSML